jgi:hypothetical protein
MNAARIYLVLLLAAMIGACFTVQSAAFGQSSDPLAGKASWRPVDPTQVRGQALDWLKQRKADAAAFSKAEEIWRDPLPAGDEDELLVRLAKTFALGDENAAKLVELCSSPRSQLVLPSQAWLREGGAAPLVANNLRLLYARWLVDEAMYDEALEQLDGLKPGDVVAPASLLFFQGIVYHAMLNKESGMKSLDELLLGADASPRRYVAVARLMQDDLKGLQPETLDHIARRMEDIRRRLDLGRAGPKVREVQDGVIKSLDQMIKKLEEEMQKQMSSTLQPGSPAQDSRIMGGKGPGEVDRKNIGSESGWGNLPPKQREEAMQQIGRDFPSHYRDAIEQYFRRLAAEGSEEK